MHNTIPIEGIEAKNREIIYSKYTYDENDEFLSELVDHLILQIPHFLIDFTSEIHIEYAEEDEFFGYDTEQTSIRICFSQDRKLEEKLSFFNKILIAMHHELNHAHVATFCQFDLSYLHRFLGSPQADELFEKALSMSGCAREAGSDNVSLPGWFHKCETHMIYFNKVLIANFASLLEDPMLRQAFLYHAFLGGVMELVAAVVDSMVSGYKVSLKDYYFNASVLLPPGKIHYSELIPKAEAIRLLSDNLAIINDLQYFENRIDRLEMELQGQGITLPIRNWERGAFLPLKNT